MCYLTQAAEYWTTGQALEAGKLIFENLPTELRPKWAAGILRFVLARANVEKSHFERLLSTADDPTQWTNGHNCFDILRDSYLELLQLKKTNGLTNSQTQLAGVISLAELVAKVTYNAANPPDEFDEDSGWWIAPWMKSYLNQESKDDELAKDAWKILSSTTA